MKRKLLSAILAIVMAVSSLPITVLSEQPQNTSENEPVLLGTETEYASALKTMFDENGLRRVSVGFNSNDGVLNKKVGLINKYGNFVVTPIYDEIELHASNFNYAENGLATALPHYFIGGYTQAVRDGKMGLLNTNGEEVVPCKYDSVRLPAEGVCAVFDKSGKLGYWSIEQNREIVEPKYKSFVGKLGGLLHKKPAGDDISAQDFIQGYALVAYEDETVNVIDKNGQEILDKHYTIDTGVFADNWSGYPQKGPYLAFCEEKDGSSYRFAWDAGKPKDKILHYPKYLQQDLQARTLMFPGMQEKMP